MKEEGFGFYRRSSNHKKLFIDKYIVKSVYIFVTAGVAQLVRVSSHTPNYCGSISSQNFSNWFIMCAMRLKKKKKVKLLS